MREIFPQSTDNVGVKLHHYPGGEWRRASVKELGRRLHRDSSSAGCILITRRSQRNALRATLDERPEESRWSFIAAAREQQERTRCKEPSYENSPISGDRKAAAATA
jgi:hypothetical protein